MRNRKKFTKIQYEVYQAASETDPETVLVKVFRYKKAAERFAAQFAPEQRIHVREIEVKDPLPT